MPKQIRKRRQSASKKPSTALIKSVIRSMPMDVDPGYTRSGGYYGRFGKGGELKFADFAISHNVDSTGELVLQCCGVAQGTTESQRIGRKITVKSVQIRAAATAVPGAGASYSSGAYWYLVLDKQANGAAAGATDVFTSTVFSEAMHNLSNSNRFVVLKKWKHFFTPSAGVATALNNVAWPIEVYKKCNIPIEYSSTTGSITEIRSNNISLFAGTDGRSDDTIQVFGICRIRFTDN